MNTIISYQAQKAVAVGYRNHWRFRVVGQGDIPNEPVYKSEWWFETLTEAPRKAQDRLSALKTAGITYKGILIAHEAPKLLSAPKPEFKNQPSIPASTPGFEGLVTAMVMGLILMFGLVFRAILIDPALIVVLKDGTWLEVMTWYE